MEPIFKTQRNRLLTSYKEANQTIIAHTIPYHSTGVMIGDVVESNSSVPPGVAFVKFSAQQQIVFFGYGVGDQVQLGGAAGFSTATEAETNLGKAASTNGAQDFIIEGIGFHCRGMRNQFAEGAAPVTNVTDLTVLNALRGNGPIYDPAAIVMPPQGQSPFNLEQGMFQALLGQASVEFLFDRQRIEKIGTLDLLPQAGAQSYLRANGSPESSNRYRIPEGYLWRKDGMSDSDLQVTVTLRRDVVVPINRVNNWIDTEGTVNYAPTKIILECVMRLYGLAVNMPSDN